MEALKINFTDEDLILIRSCLEKSILHNKRRIYQNPNFNMSKELEEQLLLDNFNMQELIVKINKVL